MSNELFSGAVPLALFVIKATLVLCAALIGAATLRRSTAGARHLVWLAALVGVLALPVLSRIPALHIGVLPTALVDDSQSLMAPLAPLTVASRSRDVSEAAHSAQSNAAPADAAAPTTPLAATSSIASPPSLLTTVAVIWASIAASLLAWLMFGALQVRRIVRMGTTLDTPDWTTPLCEVADRLDLDEAPRLVLSDRIEMAFACRALDPTIVLPASAASWTDDRRRAVLFHELAHVKRHDLASHTLGRIACALYWFHPLVWTAARQLRNESERACDDLVLACGARASEYAQHLLDMVTSVRTHGAPIMALPMARKKEFEGRMLAILDPAIRRAAPGRAQSALVVSTLGVLSLTVAAVAPSAAARNVAHETPDVSSANVALQQPVARRVDTGAKALPEPTVATRTEYRVQAETTTEAHMATKTDTKIIGPGNDAIIGGPVAESLTGAATRNGAVDGAALSQLIGAATRFGINAAAKALGGDASAPRAQQADTGRIALLTRILTSDSDAGVRRSAAWALDDIVTPGARVALIKALHADSDDGVREMSAWALAGHEGADVSEALGNALQNDKSERVRSTAAWALGSIGDRSQVNALTHAVSDPDAAVRDQAIWALGNLDLHTAPPAVIAALNDKSPSIRSVAAWTLGEIEDRAAVEPLAHAFADETDNRVRVAELHALSNFGEVPQSVLEIALKSTDPEIRRRAVAMLAGNDGSWPWPQPRPRPRPSP